MIVFLVYMFLLAFWVEKALHFRAAETVGLSISNLAFYLLVMGWCFSVVRNKKIFPYSNINKPLIALIAVFCVSLPIKLALQEVQIISLAEEIISLKAWITPPLLFFILLNAINKESTCNKILLGLLGLVILTDLSTILSSLGIIDFNRDYALSQRGRSFGFAEPNQYAAFLVLFLPMLLMVSQSIKNSIVRVMALSASCLTVVSLITTGSRSGIIVFIFSIFLYLRLMGKDRGGLGIKKVVVVFGVLLFIGAIGFAFAPQQVRDYTLMKFDPSHVQTAERHGMSEVEYYTSGRTFIWPKGFLLFLDSPLYGHGLDTFIPLMKKSFQMAVNSHNDYLLYLVNYGFIGFALLFVIIVRIFKHFLHHLRMTTNSWSKQLYACYVAGFAAYALAMFNVNLIAPPLFFWIYTATLYKYSLLTTGANKG